MVVELLMKGVLPSIHMEVFFLHHQSTMMKGAPQLQRPRLAVFQHSCPTSQEGDVPSGSLPVHENGVQITPSSVNGEESALNLISNGVFNTCPSNVFRRSAPKRFS